MGSQPLVSVLMPVFNGEKFLQAALESILQQSVTEFELLAIDDCSDDRSYQILSQCADPRVRLARNESNMGLTRSLNRGLSLATGKYVARMDADDIALPDRFDTQIRALEESGMGLSHSNVEFIDDRGVAVGHSARDFDPLVVAWKSLFDSYGFHPTFFWRRAQVETAVGRYDESFTVAQDFDFFWRASRAVGSEGISRELLRYRIHAANVTTTRRSLQQQLVSRASDRHLCELLSIDPETAKARFEGVRELTLFASADDWSPPRVEKVLCRYLELCSKFLELNGALDWNSRTESLKSILLNELVHAFGVLVSARDGRRFLEALAMLKRSRVAAPHRLVSAIVGHRLQALRVSREKKAPGPVDPAGDVQVQ